MVFKRVKIVLDLVVVDNLAKMINSFIQKFPIFIACFKIKIYFVNFVFRIKNTIKYHENYWQLLQQKQNHPYQFSSENLHQIRTCSY